MRELIRACVSTDTYNTVRTVGYFATLEKDVNSVKGYAVAVEGKAQNQQGICPSM